ncbi:hypothetical protein FS749_010552, partial [Ceratobasidium sp. UAMH 11750]
MQLWLCHGFGGMTKVLRARRTRGDPLQLTLPGELAEELLRSVAVLDLDDVTIPWTSTVYHNLVDLRLWFSLNREARISTSQLATILTSSLGLVTLKIYGLEVTSLDDWDATTVVHLVHLEVLYLGSLSRRSCELLLPLIPLSNCSNNLSIGLEFRDWAGIAHSMRDFLRGTQTRKLACCGDQGNASPRWALSLAEILPVLEDLVLYEFQYLGAEEIRDMASEHQPSPDGDQPHGIVAPCLPRLYVVSSQVNLEGLSFIISRCGVRNIHLEKCSARTARELSVRDIEVRLRRDFPDLVCIISNDDTTRGWPCRVVYL